MRRKISKKLRKAVLSSGAIIEREYWIKESDWLRKHCGYCVELFYQGWKVSCLGHDELAAMRLALSSCKDDWYEVNKLN